VVNYKYLHWKRKKEETLLDTAIHFRWSFYQPVHFREEH